MFYQLNRPFQEYPIYFDLPDDAPYMAALPLWFGTAWQPADPSLRAGAKSLLTLQSDAENPLGEIQNFVYENTTCREPYFVFHGGAVTRGEDAYLFLAATTTGKTTLIAYLSQLGYTYLNDDCFYMHMDTLEVMPYSAPIHLREGGFSYLQSVLKDPLPPCVHMGSPHSMRHIFWPQQQAQIPTKPKRIFFLNRTDDPSLADCCASMPAFAALNRLFTSALVPYHMNKRYIQFFQKLTPLCYELTYHDAPYVAKLLESSEIGGYDA